MDNNSPAPTSPTPPQPVQPSPVVVQPDAGKDSKMGLWMIIGVILVFVAVGGIYWYLSSQQAAQNTIVPLSDIKLTPPETNLNDELNSIDVESSGSSDFIDVDSDISGI